MVYLSWKASLMYFPSSSWERGSPRIESEL